MIFDEDIQPEAYKALQVKNLARQIEFVKDTTVLSIKHQPNLCLTAQYIRDVHAIALVGLLDSPGAYRKEEAQINTSSHILPPYEDVATHIQTLCVKTKKLWGESNPFDLAAYVLWRITWIHPFSNGNGRTADAVAYYILCKKFKTWFAGENIIPTYWHSNRDTRYYDALKAADSFGEDSLEAIAELADLMRRALHHQLKTASPPQ